MKKFLIASMSCLMLLSGVELPVQASKYHHYKAPMISKTFYAPRMKDGENRLKMNERADHWVWHVSNIRDYKITTSTGLASNYNNDYNDSIGSETVVLTRRHESRVSKQTNSWLKRIDRKLAAIFSYMPD